MTPCLEGSALRLSSDNIKALLAKLNKTLKPCGACGSGKWKITDTVFELREFNQGGLVVGGGSQLLPVIALMCDVCGNTLLFNALILDLVERPPVVRENSNGKQ